MRTPAVAATASGAPAVLPIVTLIKNLNASNVGTGKNLAAISNYYTRLAINDNNFLRERGYLFSEAGLALSVDNIGVSLGGFVASFFQLTKDVLNLVGGGLTIGVASIALLRLLPAGPTPGVTQAQIAANLAAMRGRHLLANGTHSKRSHSSSSSSSSSSSAYPTLDAAGVDASVNASATAEADPADLFSAFSKQAFVDSQGSMDLYCSIMQQIARIDLISGGMQAVQQILEDNTAGVLDGLTPSNMTCVYTPEALQRVSMMHMGGGGMVPTGGPYSECPAAPATLREDPGTVVAATTANINVTTAAPVVAAAPPLYFSPQQLAQNQSNYNLFLRNIPTILIYPRAQPGEPNFIGTGLTPVQSSNLQFIAAVLALSASILSELANSFGLVADTIVYLLRFPGIAIQIAQLEISAGVFEATLERDYSPGE
ncbi:MAG: hypothetical protein WDW38_011395 [Sanguina aurantia]